ncbi:MAG TPA: YceI family protein [Methylomirabilota bacterium]|nr:YceI family protein [Methylomirabilota bacterium]
MPAAPRLAALLTALILGAAALAPPAVAESRKFTVESDKSRVLVDVFHPWAIGRFSAGAEHPTGEFEIDVDDLRQSTKGTLTVQAAAFRSGRAGRDKDIRRALDAEHHPEIRYRIDKVDSSFPSLAENNDVFLTIHGVLSIKGVDRPATFAGRVRRTPGGGLWVRGEGWVKPQDFGVPLIRTWLVSMKDSVLAMFDLTLTQPR